LLNEPFGGVIPGARGAVLSTLLRTDARLTGRQVHALVSDRHSLWSVQEALKAWVQLGVIRTQVVGRAVVHAINEDHCTIAFTPRPDDSPHRDCGPDRWRQRPGHHPLWLRRRGEAREGSDIDLAVIAHSGWDGRVDLEDGIRGRLGNDCNALVFTAEDFARLVAAHEPVVDEILVDGIPLIGTVPRVKSGAA
jgi:hypothetical protein